MLLTCKLEAKEKRQDFIITCNFSRGSTPYAPFYDPSYLFLVSPIFILKADSQSSL